MGRYVSHVSLISDAFGYDIESASGQSRYYIEVKTTLETRAETFFITKNETQKAAGLKDQWRLVQIVLTPEAITQEEITGVHVIEARALDSSTLLSLIPVDKDTGIWVDSAVIRPPSSAWTAEVLNLPDDWHFGGYRFIANPE